MEARSRRPLPTKERDDLAELIEAVGERRAMELLEVSRQTLARLVGGLRVTRGTLALVRQHMATLDQGRAA